MDKLSKQLVWDLITAREQDENAKARYNNIKVHFGDIFGICGLKGSELKRMALPRNGKADSYSADATSRMNTMTLRFSMSYFHPRQHSRHPKQYVDACGLIEKQTSSQCDAEHAYVPSRLGGTETWVRIPKDRRPAEWAGKFRKPVVLLKLALYGHPDAGGYWESHCEERLTDGGFTPVPDWNSTHWHSKLKLLLMVFILTTSKCMALAKTWARDGNSSEFRLKPMNRRRQANAWVVTT